MIMSKEFTHVILTDDQEVIPFAYSGTGDLLEQAMDESETVHVVLTINEFNEFAKRVGKVFRQLEPKVVQLRPAGRSHIGYPRNPNDAA